MRTRQAAERPQGRESSSCGEGSRALRSSRRALPIQQPAKDKFEENRHQSRRNKSRTGADLTRLAAVAAASSPVVSLPERESGMSSNVDPSRGLTRERCIIPSKFYEQISSRLRAGTSASVDERNHSFYQQQRKNVARVKGLADDERLGLDFELSVLCHWDPAEERYIVHFADRVPSHVNGFGAVPLSTAIEKALALKTGSLNACAKDFAIERTSELRDIISDAALKSGSVVDGQPVINVSLTASILVRPEKDSKKRPAFQDEESGAPKVARIDL